ncbi:MAG: 6-pyruvoyl-tetrahydropterin synthase-related protein [Chloroflexota bacterium]
MKRENVAQGDLRLCFHVSRITHLLKPLSSWLKKQDIGFLVVLTIAWIAIWPFLRHPSLPQGTDAELHVFRLVELSHLVRGGEFYPRWAPNFYHGYGYPIFNYYAPLTYYVGLVVELLPGYDAVDGIKFVFVLGILLSAVGMYGFVRDNWGREAGWVATAVFIYAPYLQYVDPHVRGALPEAFSFGTFAMALWALDRLRQRGGVGAWITAVLATAAVILTHNLMALLFFGILVAWAVWVLAIGRLEAGDWKKPATSFLLLAALFLGLGVAAFFWLPVGLERNEVNLNTLIGDNNNYDFRTHFLSLREMLAPSLWLDWGATEPAFRFNLGVAQWLLGVLGLVMLLLRRVKDAGHVAFFALGTAVHIFLMLPASTFIWEALPFLPFFQFPWRLLGAVAAMLAVLAGVGVQALGTLDLSGLSSKALTAVFLLLPILFSFPVSVPTPWADFGPATLLTMTQIEHRGRWLGTTSTADYVPATVDTVPQRKGEVIRGYYEDFPVERLNLDSLPDVADVTQELVTPLHFRYTTSAPKDFLLRLYHFQFPGWQAFVDGEAVEIELARPDGFMVVPAPAGEHVVDVRFGTTSGRMVAWGITVGSLVVMMFVGWQVAGGRWQVTSDVFTQHLPLAASERTAVFAVLALTAVYLLILQPFNLLHYDSNGLVAESAGETAVANFGEQIALIGYDRSAIELEAGNYLDLTIYWKAQQPLDINYQSFIHVLDASGVLVAQSDHLNPGEFPTRRWPLDKFVRDPHQLYFAPDLTPGAYTVAAGLWVQTEGWRLPLLDENGQQVDDKFVLYEIVIR